MQHAKVDRKELNDTRQKFLTVVGEKADQIDLQKVLQEFISTNTQKLLDMRSELLAKLAEMQTNTAEILTKKCNYDDFKSVIEEKVDVVSFSAQMKQKISSTEFEQVKYAVEKLSKEVLGKANAIDLENTGEYFRANMDGLGKELMLRASGKDVCQLLDTKANIEDFQKTVEYL